MNSRIKNIINPQDTFDKMEPKTFCCDKNDDYYILSWKTLNNQLKVMKCFPQQLKMVEELLIELGYTKGDS